MLVIKLKLMGKKGQHSFRVIVQEKRAKLQGEAVDDLGWFNPHANQIKLNQERLKYWLGNGAQPTESAQKVIDKAGSDSAVRSFEGRKSAKKKKKDKKETAPSAAPVGTEIVPPVGAAEAAKTSVAEAGAGESPTVPEAATEEIQKEKEKVE